MKEISTTEQILLTGATLPPTGEWLIVRVGETTEQSSGFKFAIWKNKLEKWIDETGQDITDKVIMWAKIPARNPKLTISEESLYSKEDLSKIERLRREAENEKKRKKEFKERPITYLKDLKVGDKIYHRPAKSSTAVFTIVKKYKDRVDDWRGIARRTFVLLKKGIVEVALEYNENTSVVQYFKPDLSHVVVRESIKNMTTRDLLDKFQSCNIGFDYVNDTILLEMKAELNTREHIPNKKENKIIRKNKASQKNRRTR